MQASALQGAGAALSPAAALVAGVNARADRARAMRIPTISRGRDLLCSLAASLPIRHYAETWTGAGYERIELEPDPWMHQPERRVTRAHTLSWTVDDLLFSGRSHWYTLERRASDGRPARFLRLPAAEVLVQADAYDAGVPIGDYSLTWRGQTIPSADVVTFWSPNGSVLDNGARTILLAERLDQSALRFAANPVAFTTLRQTGGEPLSSDELRQLADDWAAMRDTAAVAAINEYVEVKDSEITPDRLQSLESRQHMGLELSRLINVPAYLVGAPSGGSLTYLNAQQAKADLVLFGAAPLLECISQTLSTDQVTAPGTVIELDRSSWIDNPLDSTTGRPIPADQIGAPA